MEVVLWGKQLQVHELKEGTVMHGTGSCKWGEKPADKENVAQACFANGHPVIHASSANENF